MELHKALRQIIKTDGADIICEPRLVNILSDLNAYGDIQGARYIMRALIDEGVTRNLLQIGSYDNQAKDLGHRFVTNTGFNEDAVRTILNSLAYGLEWIKRMPKAQATSQSSTTKSTQPSQSNLGASTPQPKSTSKKWSKKMTEDETDEFFLSITEMEEPRSTKYGVQIKNLAYFVTDDGDMLGISSEIFSINKKREYVSLWYAFYDQKGRVITTTFSTAKTPDTPNPNPIMRWEFIKPQKISKIRLYWD